ncbi:cupin domain-containing protein [Rhodoblastus sp. 17X3]|uniref:cupin domain-containing protein n=1 Tax=Rhodoblastus sp. 17X3 TaxID=3047026 RepID=UPI0024B7797C|nr:cupin domain-containing protein [Rhodoblastus sp. 17X3]MDI9849221.1 cupin domain-containing protein [Rhodoblastus sp. 17X3]
MRDPSLDARAVREALGLAPHPEGGAYREIWRDAPDGGGRGAATSILFLREAGERSHWHRVDAAELWIWQAGAPLKLEIARAPGPSLRMERSNPSPSLSRPESGFLRDARNDGKSVRLGPNLNAGETLQAVVPAHAWQAAQSLGAWTLASCVVAPAFNFSGFELAPPGWSPC